MGTQNIPVPAESLRRLAEGAAVAARLQREAGRKGNADHISRDVAEALRAASANDGEFVSVPSGVASTLAAYGLDGGDVPEARRHKECAKHYLKQYKHW